MTSRCPIGCGRCSPVAPRSSTAKNGKREVYLPTEGRYVEDPEPRDEISLAALKTDEQKTLWQNEDAALLDLGDGVALYEFRSKANSLGQKVIQGLMEVIEKVENDRDLRGVVIGNEGNNFSVGANLGEVAMAAAQGEFEMLGTFVRGFQQAIQRIRYAAKPVVVAVHQRVLGGGCEMVMACPNPVAVGGELHRPRRARRRPHPGGYRLDAARRTRQQPSPERLPERDPAVSRQILRERGDGNRGDVRAAGAGDGLPRPPRPDRDERRPPLLRRQRRGAAALE